MDEIRKQSFSSRALRRNNRFMPDYNFARAELKKPKDAGPRMINGGFPEVNMGIVHFIPIANMEAEQKFDSSLIQTMAKIIAVLPSLEV